MMSFWVNWDNCEFMTENEMKEYRSELAKEFPESEIREEYGFGQYVNENYEPMEILAKGLTEDVLKLAYEYHISRLIDGHIGEMLADEGWEHVFLSD